MMFKLANTTKMLPDALLNTGLGLGLDLSIFVEIQKNKYLNKMNEMS